MNATPPPLKDIESEQENPTDLPIQSSEFKCTQCGAKLSYMPGTQTLTCEYCQHTNIIPKSADDIKELDFVAFIQTMKSQEQNLEERLLIKCSTCGAETTAEANITAQACPFCDSEIVSASQSKKTLKPKALLPFKVKMKEAGDLYKKWLQSLWFAPNALKQKTQIDHRISGIYVPHWTYDADTLSYYTGSRGVYYYVPVTTTSTDSQGRTQTRTTMQRRTSWSPASGTVTNEFDDVLIPASQSLPEKYTRALEPWDLNHLIPYQDEYLSGFKAQSYQISLEKGFEKAKDVMEDEIRQSVCRHIGGDEQIIHSLKVQHNHITFKHILLPVWLSAYRFKEKVYTFMVNARTGEVQGERPWSWWKITFTSLGLVALILTAIYFYQQSQVPR